MQRLHQGWAELGKVGIKFYDPVVVRYGITCSQCIALPGNRFINDFRACRPGHQGGIVGRTVIDHNHFHRSRA